MTWSPTGDLPGLIEAQRMTLLPHGHVLLVGFAVPGGPSTALYDPASGSWTPWLPTRQDRSSAPMATLPNGEVLPAGGGYIPDNTVIASAEIIYPPRTKHVSSPDFGDRWRAASCSSGPRGHLAGPVFLAVQASRRRRTNPASRGGECSTKARK
jgi:hypothetical protein